MLRELNGIERSRHVTSRRRIWRNPSRHFTAPETWRHAQHWLAVDMLMGVVVAVALVVAVVVVSFGMFCIHTDSSIFVMTGLS